MHVDFIWETCIGCKNLQNFDIKIHEKIVNHKNLVARWEIVYFLQHVYAPLIIKGLNIMVYREQSRIIIVMKTLYFTIWNVRLILCYQDTYQLFSLLQTLNIPIDDEYDSYTSRYVVLEFWQSISKHINNEFIHKHTILFIWFFDNKCGY